MTDHHNTAAREAARARLGRLEQFVQDDVTNLTLLGDAFETALRCQEWPRAEFHLRHGISASNNAPAWRLKEGDLLLAQGRLAEATDVLERLLHLNSPPPGFREVVAHNLAFIESAQGAWTACIERLSPMLEPTGGATSPEFAKINDTVSAAMQTLWLRALHHTRHFERALAWTRAAETAKDLRPAAAGVASLIAFDAGDLADAERWSALDLAQATGEDRPVEALTTQASLALAAGNYPLTRARIDQALTLSPADGRAWSMRAFADLAEGDLATAERHFDLALTTMATHIGTWHGKGWTHILQRRLEDAQSAFEQALVLDRNFAESHGGLAVVLAMRGAKLQAREHVELAGRLDRANLSGRYAEALLDGSATDLENFSKLVNRLLSGRTTLRGVNAADWILNNASAMRPK